MQARPIENIRSAAEFLNLFRGRMSIGDVVDLSGEKYNTVWMTIHRDILNGRLPLAICGTRQNKEFISAVQLPAVSRLPSQPQQATPTMIGLASEVSARNLAEAVWNKRRSIDFKSNIKSLARVVDNPAVSQVGRREVRKIMSSLLQRGIKHTTMKCYWRDLRKLLNEAVLQGLLKRNPLNSTVHFSF